MWNSEGLPRSQGVQMFELSALENLRMRQMIFYYLNQWRALTRVDL